VLLKRLAEIERDYSKKLSTALKSANSALSPETTESGLVKNSKLPLGGADHHVLAQY